MMEEDDVPWLIFLHLVRQGVVYTQMKQTVTDQSVKSSCQHHPSMRQCRVREAEESTASCSQSERTSCVHKKSLVSTPKYSSSLPLSQAFIIISLTAFVYTALLILDRTHCTSDVLVLP